MGRVPARTQRDAHPAATSEAAAEATPVPRLVEVPAEDGMAAGELIALIVAAAGIGAIAAHVAARSLPRARRRAEAKPMRRRAGARPAPPRPAPPRPAPPRPAPPAAARPAPARDAPAAANPAFAALRGRFARKPRAAPARGPESKPAAARPHPQRRPSTTGRFEPTAAARRAPGRCSIKLVKRSPLGRFVALDDDTGRLLARSPVFKLERAEGDEGPSPREALAMFVEELTAAGWRRTGVGPSPWELRFERQPEALTRRANPPRA